MQKDISPEEKLLSIIKRKRKKVREAPLSPEAGQEEGRIEKAPAGNKIDDFILKVLKNSFLKNTIFAPEVLRVFNKYMVLALAALAVYLFFEMLLVKPSRKAASTLSRIAVSSLASPLSRTQPAPEQKSYASYSARIAGKKIFKGGYGSQAEYQEGPLPGEKAEDSLGLVGIIPGKNPQAIVEEKKSQKTYYLIIGQSIEGITVEDISEGKVMLDYRGKKMTLFL